MINKVVAGLVTIGFMYVVRPDPEPSRWSIAFASVLLYEGIRWSLDYTRKVNRKKKEAHYITVTRQDMRRWADEWIRWPMKEVS